MNAAQRKFNEYIKNIHSILSDAVNHLDHVQFVNQILDRLEYINRSFTLMNGIKEDVYTYQQHLEKLSDYTTESLQWLQNYDEKLLTGIRTDDLKNNFFMLNDMFTTSKNLIKSFYPAN